MKNTLPSFPGWQTVVSRLYERMTLTEMTALTRVSQPVLSDLKEGKRGELRFAGGSRLYLLYVERILKRKVSLTK